MHGSDSRPLEDLFGQIILPHARGRGVHRGLQHHQIDQACDTCFARGHSHRRGRVKQAVLHRIGEIDDEVPCTARCTERTSRKSPSNISAPSARRCSERSSILWTKARTGIPRLSSISDTCRPVLPSLPPAPEVTRTGFPMGASLCIFLSLGTIWYQLL